MGILNHLEDSCRLMNESDSGFMGRLRKDIKDTPRVKVDHQVAKMQFTIIHYAGEVEYSAKGFVEKNMGDLPQSVCELWKKSTDQVVRELANNSPQRTANKQTVSGQFRLQLQCLTRKIDDTSPHFIRCLRANKTSSDQTHDFDEKLITEQLNNTGVIEAMRVSRLGYPQQYSHEKFIVEFHMLEKKECSSTLNGANAGEMSVTAFVCDSYCARSRQHLTNSMYLYFHQTQRLRAQPKNLL